MPAKTTLLKLAKSYMTRIVLKLMDFDCAKRKGVNVVLQIWHVQEYFCDLRFAYAHM